LAISFGRGSSNEIAKPGSNFSRKWDCFVRCDAGQGNRDIALPHSNIRNPNAAGETGRLVTPKSDEGGRGAPANGPDPKQTAKTYTDARMLPLKEAIEKLNFHRAPGPSRDDT
jgi:hypothetical protein